MPPVVFEPKISAGELSQNYALDRADTGTGTPDFFTIRSFLSLRLEFFYSASYGIWYFEPYVALFLKYVN
jgi:hypothetical protein